MLLPPLLPALLLRRYQRFLADVRLADGSTATAHCANSGSMRGLAAPGTPLLLSRATTPGRKLPYTWELAQLPGGWVGVHTGRTNQLVEEALTTGVIPELAGYPTRRREVTPPGSRSRLDFLLQGEGRPDCFVEVKSVTLGEGAAALFPDAVTQRGTRHLEELIRLHAAGNRAVLLFVVQRPDCHTFRAAAAIDPLYAATLDKAALAGVEVLVYRCRVTPDQITLTAPLPWEPDGP